MYLKVLPLVCSFLGVGVISAPLPQFFGNFNPFPQGFFNPFPQVYRFQQTFYPDGNGGYFNNFFNPPINGSAQENATTPGFNPFNPFNYLPSFSEIEKDLNASETNSYEITSSKYNGSVQYGPGYFHANFKVSNYPVGNLGGFFYG